MDEFGTMIRNFVIWIIGICLICSIIFGGYSIISRYIRTNADRIIHKQSITYNEGVLDDLAKYRLEMIQTENEITKKAIADTVNHRFANYDESKIESQELKDFLSDCRNMNIGGY